MLIFTDASGMNFSYPHSYWPLNQLHKIIHQPSEPLIISTINHKVHMVGNCTHGTSATALTNLLGICWDGLGWVSMSHRVPDHGRPIVFSWGQVATRSSQEEHGQRQP